VSYLDKLKTLEHDAPTAGSVDGNLQVTKKPAQPGANSAPGELTKLYAPNRFPGRHDNKTLSCDIEAGEIVAVEIASEVLGADIWLSFRDDFNPGDGKATFYAHELPMLRTKTAAELREIHKVKFGVRARQQSEAMSNQKSRLRAAAEDIATLLGIVLGLFALRNLAAMLVALIQN
jgi:hypothetical protein